MGAHILLMLMVAIMGHMEPLLAVRLPLDMAPNSVDDAYTKCTQEMSNRISKIIDDEKNTNADFKEAWKVATLFCKNIELTDGLTRNHAIAIRAYVSEFPKIYDKFNAAVRSGKKDYKTTFNYHALHFLLTDALKLLKKKNQGKCETTLRGTKLDFDTNVVNKEIRFGSFTSSSYDVATATKFGGHSCFEISTCYGAPLGKYSYLPHEEEVLIPPYEKFKVVKVEKKSEKKDLWCDIVYTVKSTGTLSNLDCALVG